MDGWLTTPKPHRATIDARQSGILTCVLLVVVHGCLSRTISLYQPKGARDITSQFQCQRRVVEAKLNLCYPTGVASTDKEMIIAAVQQCRSLDGWQVVSIASHSGDGYYVVHANPWGEVSAYVCECKGYLYRGECRHQEAAAEHICGWSEIVDNSYTELMQTEPQKSRGICPQCGGRTMWVMELVYAEEAEERWQEERKQLRAKSTR